jgi:deoxycytidylate deaminase
MNKNLLEKILDISKKLKDVPSGTNRHFSFIIDKNRILSLGWNDYYCSNRIAYDNGHVHGGIHSEFSAYVRYRGDFGRLRRCIMVNTRINSLDKIGMSKPCTVCQKFIEKVGFRKVYYTNILGQWEILNVI